MDKTVQEELQKQLEFSMEEERLKEITEIINDEILKYIDKRKAVLEYILNYRKKVIEEFKDDEDKLIEYFDHERYVKEENFKLIDRKLKELTVLKSSPYFGKISFREEDFGIESIYIGRFGVTLENSFDPLIVDWRAPIASLFYNGGGENAHYEAPVGKVWVSILARYQYIIKKGILQGLFNSEVDIKDDILQMVLSKNSSDKLKDIVMTIQKEQDIIIRQPKNKIVVVDGVAGSGKTTIALHRIAYLIYNYRKILEGKVLILGPNTIFMEYICNVLPTLGETGVFQTTFRDLAMDILDVDNVMDMKDVMERVFSKDEKFIKTLQYKRSSQYVEFLDRYIEDLNHEYFACKDVVYRGLVAVTQVDMEKMFREDFLSLPLFRRNKKIKRIVFSKLKDIRDEKIREIEEHFKKEKESYNKEELNLHINNIEFRRKLAIKELIYDLIKVKNSLKYLNGQSIESLYSILNCDEMYTEEDLIAMLYLKIKLQGLKLKQEIKHVVIDEAQDYSELQFRIIKAITGVKSMTIVGDGNQRLLSNGEEVPLKHLKDIFKDAEVDTFKLDKSYRSTKEIMEYSNRFIKDTNLIPMVRSGEVVEEIAISQQGELKNFLKSYIKDMKENGLENIAIICKDLKTSEIINELISDEFNTKFINKDHAHGGEGIFIIPSYYAKGLEFDGAIVIADESEMVSPNNIMYVMCTRALHKLYIIKTNE